MKNYYTIHKNKKPKKRLHISKVDRKTVRIIMHAVSITMKRAQYIFEASQHIPKYNNE